MILISCQSSNSQSVANKFIGTYQGLWPCADCAGINQKLVLNLNKTYTLTSTYLSKSPTSFTEEGTFTFDKSSLTLRLSNQYAFKIKGTKLLMLDDIGHPISGELADNYSLTKLLVGADRDSHGCIPSAGYIWSDEQNICIRPWETSKEN